jgi:hypothetical protein
MTKIFHPNVSVTGEICVNTLKKDWKKELGLKHILLVSIMLHIYIYICLVIVFVLRVCVCVYMFDYQGKFLSSPRYHLMSVLLLIYLCI